MYRTRVYSGVCVCVCGCVGGGADEGRAGRGGCWATAQGRKGRSLGAGGGQWRPCWVGAGAQRQGSQRWCWDWGLYSGAALSPWGGGLMGDLGRACGAQVRPSWEMGPGWGDPLEAGGPAQGREGPPLRSPRTPARGRGTPWLRLHGSGHPGAWAVDPGPPDPTLASSSL